MVLNGDNRQISSPCKGQPDDPLHVLSIPPIGNAALSITPFGGKVEVILRLAGLEYTAVTGDPADKTTVSKGKFPVLKHGKAVVPDSSAIFDYLQETFPKEMSIFSPPDSRTAALAHSLQRMLEEHSYFTSMYALWQVKEIAIVYGSSMMAKMMPAPAFLLRLIVSYLRSTFVRTLHGQGMGRHTIEEVQERLVKDLVACVTLLEESGEYLTGASPSQADCYLFAALHLAHEAYVDLPYKPMHAEMLLQQPVLVDFYNRMWPRVFVGASGGIPDSRWTQENISTASDAPAGLQSQPHARTPWLLYAAIATSGIAASGMAVCLWHRN